MGRSLAGSALDGTAPRRLAQKRRQHRNFRASYSDRRCRITGVYCASAPPSPAPRNYRVDDEASPQPIPVKFVRIDCHVAANANYSISIWHLFLEGYSSKLTPSIALPDGPALVSLYESHRHLHTTRLILAHLRRSGPMYLPAFQTLLSTLPSPSPTASGGEARLEHPLLTSLHEALVLRGDWDASERILDDILASGLLDEWDGTAGGTKGQTVAKWERIGPPPDREVEAIESYEWPSGRGGHAMVRVARRVLLYGGWDGKRELGDMWEYELPLSAHDISTPRRWRLLDSGEPDQGQPAEGSTARPLRPGPRSCHQMVVDERDGWVYMLGARRDELDDIEHDGRDEPSAYGTGATGGTEGGMDVDGGADQPTAAPANGTATSSTGTNGRTNSPGDRWKSDFWRYKAIGPDRGKWELLSEDTRKDSGPALL